MKLHILSCGLLGLFVLPSAHAVLLEGFDSPSVAHPRIGDVIPVDASFFFPDELPPQGSRQLLLTTASTGADGGSYSGIDAATISSVESLLNLQAGTIPSGGSLGDASAIKLALNLSAGDVVSFQFRFLTSAEDIDGNDFAFYTLQFESGTPTLTTFADTTDANAASNSALFNYESAVVTVTLPAASFAGSYTLGFGVADRGDDAVQSGVLIDNVQVVPEPSSLVTLLVGGLAGVGFSRRRCREGRQVSNH